VDFLTLLVLIISWILAVVFQLSFTVNYNLQAKDVNDLISWKSLASTQLDGLLRDNLILRLLLFLSDIFHLLLGTMLLKFVYTAYIWHCFFYKKNP
jgi:hypothetical protein